MTLNELIEEYISNEFKPRITKVGKVFRKTIRVNQIDYLIAYKENYLPKIKKNVYYVFGVDSEEIDKLIIQLLN